MATRLRREISEYGQLLHLYEEQQHLILRNSPRGVLEAGRAIEAQVRILDRERQLREDSVGLFAAANGQPAGSTLRSLLPLVEEDARPLFDALILEINLLIHRVRRDAQRNHRLLRCMVDCHQEILQRLRPDGFTKTYARNGRVSVAAARPALASQADN